VKYFPDGPLPAFERSTTASEKADPTFDQTVGGEGGIRTRQDHLESVTYRSHIAVAAIYASVAVARCTPLHRACSALVSRQLRERHCVDHRRAKRRLRARHLSYTKRHDIALTRVSARADNPLLEDERSRPRRARGAGTHESGIDPIFPPSTVRPHTETPLARDPALDHAEQGATSRTVRAMPEVCVWGSAVRPQHRSCHGTGLLRPLLA
jgi:hypothetical protein